MSWISDSSEDAQCYLPFVRMEEKTANLAIFRLQP